MESTDFSLLPGTTLHSPTTSYKIVRTLGQGTFGITYLAEVNVDGALSALGVTVYVTVKEFFMSKINGRKDTSVTNSDDGGYFEYYKKRFIKEAQNLKTLNHPNIVKVAEAFESNGTAYYVMEYIDGETLSSIINRKGRIHEQQAINLTLQVTNALAYMHNKKMLHLDIKPSNIMISNGKAVLIDFGLSKQYTESGEPESSTTIGLGTPGYAPLEQANYHEHNGLPATLDIYALGATMMKMLTGISEMPPASEILNDGFPTSLFHESGVSALLTDIVEKAMAPLKKNRYQTVEELHSNLAKLSRSTENTQFDPKLDQRNGQRREQNEASDVIGNNNGCNAKLNGNKIEQKSRNIEQKDINNKPNGIKYKYFTGLAYLIEEWLFSFLMLCFCSVRAPDGDGRRLLIAFLIAAIFVFVWIMNRCRILPIGLLKKIGWGITALVVGNALLLPTWDPSLTFSFFALSVLFAPISALLMMIRKD